MRINKYFVDIGYCSRRKADELIQAGRVHINEQIATAGAQVNKMDIVKLDGKILAAPPSKNTILLAYHKPRGVECTANPQVKNNIINAINYPERLVNIGRLDKNSEGLIFLSNDGELVNRFTHPRYKHEKEYLVTLKQEISPEALAKLSQGLVIDGHKTQPCQVSKLHNKKITIILTEGRNRQIRKMLNQLDLDVSRLQRVRIGKFKLKGLKVGTYKQIHIDDVLSNKPSGKF